MSDADFEMLRADVLGTNNQVSSPPSTIQSMYIVLIYSISLQRIFKSKQLVKVLNLQ